MAIKHTHIQKNFWIKQKKIPTSSRGWWGSGALTHSTQQHIKSFHLIPQDYIWDLIHDCHKTDQGNWQEESVYKFLVDWDTESCPPPPP